MDEAAQEVQQLDLPTFAVLFQTKAGAGAEARAEFAAAVVEKFGYIQPAEVDQAWSQATVTISGEGEKSR